MDFTETPEDRAFRAKARDWLQTHVPREERPLDGDASIAFDKAWQRQQFDAGWAGIAWPTAYGGLGLPLVQQMIWWEEYARAEAPNVGHLFVGLNHGGPTLIERGSDAQKAFHLPRILSGDAVWCQGFSEPGAGSDLAGIRTRAVLDEDHLIVSGSKIWTSFAQHADYQELLVRTDPTSRRHRGLSWVICDMRAPGIEIRPIINITGTHDFNQVFYNDVRIPLTEVVGGLNDGWKTAMTTFSFERGTGMICFQVELAHLVEELINYARENTGLDGRPLLQDEEIASRLATLRAEISALRAMTYLNISRAQRGADKELGSPMTIAALYHGELAKRIERAAFDLAGPCRLELHRRPSDWTYQYLRSFPKTIAGGTSEIRRNIIAERVLGLPRV